MTIFNSTLQSGQELTLIGITSQFNVNDPNAIDVFSQPKVPVPMTKRSQHTLDLVHLWQLLVLEGIPEFMLQTFGPSLAGCLGGLLYVTGQGSLYMRRIYPVLLPCLHSLGCILFCRGSALADASAKYLLS